MAAEFDCLTTKGDFFYTGSDRFVWPNLSGRESSAIHLNFKLISFPIRE